MEKEGESRRPARILAVDDSPTSLALLERILRRGGYADVTVTSDSREVPALVASLDPDLLLTDLNMPPPGGFELIEALRRHAPDRPSILVLSGSSAGEIQQRAVAAGAQGLLGKPFRAAELLERVRELLGAQLDGPSTVR